MRPAAARSRDAVSEGGGLGQAAAKDQERIRGLDPFTDDIGRAETGHAEVERVLVRDHVPAPPRRDHRDAQQLGEACQVRRRAGPQDPRPGQDQRPLRIRKQTEHGADIVVGRTGRRWTAELDPGLTRDGLVEQVLGKRQQDRAGPAAEGLLDGFRERARKLVDGSRLGAPLGKPPEGLGLVDLLECLPAAIVSLDLADDREHRCRVLQRGVDPDRQVGRPNRARPEAGRRSAGQLSVGLGHERCRALVPGRDDADPDVAERLEDAEEALAGDGERVADAGGAQGLGHEMTGRTGLGRFLDRRGLGFERRFLGQPGFVVGRHGRVVVPLGRSGFDRRRRLVGVLFFGRLKRHRVASGASNAGLGSNASGSGAGGASKVGFGSGGAGSGSSTSSGAAGCCGSVTTRSWGLAVLEGHRRDDGGQDEPEDDDDGEHEHHDAADTLTRH